MKKVTLTLIGEDHVTAVLLNAVSELMKEEVCKLLDMKVEEVEG